MSWEDSDGVERGGSCAECGEPVEEEHHAYCPDCYAEQQGWTRRTADLDTRASIENRQWERLLERVRDLEHRVAELERKRAA